VPHVQPPLTVERTLREAVEPSRIVSPVSPRRTGEAGTSTASPEVHRVRAQGWLRVDGTTITGEVTFAPIHEAYVPGLAGGPAVAYLFDNVLATVTFFAGAQVTRKLTVGYR
jgi:hypothetical protein